MLRSSLKTIYLQLKTKKHLVINKNILKFLVKYGVAFIGSWQLDLIVSPLLNKYPDIFYLPVGFQSIFPFIRIAWDATVWSSRDAYVRFFMMIWLAILIDDLSKIVILKPIKRLIVEKYKKWKLNQSNVPVVES